MAPWAFKPIEAPATSRSNTNIFFIMMALINPLLALARRHWPVRRRKYNAATPGFVVKMPLIVGSARKSEQVRCFEGFGRAPAHRPDASSKPNDLGLGIYLLKPMAGRRTGSGVPLLWPSYRQAIPLHPLTRLRSDVKPRMEKGVALAIPFATPGHIP
jgi:hypothetical protein